MMDEETREVEVVETAEEEDVATLIKGETIIYELVKEEAEIILVLPTEDEAEEIKTRREHILTAFIAGSMGTEQQTADLDKRQSLSKIKIKTLVKIWITHKACFWQLPILQKMRIFGAWILAVATICMGERSYFCL
jgi:hypothetical protein